jgi:hypothetical protein
MPPHDEEDGSRGVLPGTWRVAGIFVGNSILSQKPQQILKEGHNSIFTEDTFTNHTCMLDDSVLTRTL